MEVIQNLRGPFRGEILDKVSALDKSFFELPWDYATWEKLGDSYRMSLLRSDDGKLLGFTLFQCLPMDDMAHLLKIIIDPAFRGQKMGRELFEQTIDSTLRDRHRVFLEVSDQNAIAIKFYLSFGFKKLNHTKNYYSNGDGAFSMELML